MALQNLKPYSSSTNRNELFKKLFCILIKCSYDFISILYWKRSNSSSRETKPWVTARSGSKAWKLPNSRRNWRQATTGVGVGLWLHLVILYQQFYKFGKTLRAVCPNTMTLEITEKWSLPRVNTYHLILSIDQDFSRRTNKSPTPRAAPLELNGFEGLAPLHDQHHQKALPLKTEPVWKTLSQPRQSIFNGTNFEHNCLNLVSNDFLILILSRLLWKESFKRDYRLRTSDR